MLKWILIIVGGLFSVVVLVIGMGALMPREHMASSSITLHQPPDSIWPVVRDLGATPEWWSDITSSEPAPQSGEGERWIQKTKTGTTPLVIVREDPPRLLRTRIDMPDDAAFGGTWTYEIEPVNGGSRVTITEDGFINNLLFRFMANTVFSLHGTMDGYLRALGRRYGEEVDPEHRR